MPSDVPAVVEFGLLGPVRLSVRSVDVPLGGLKRRTGFAILVANRNRVTSTAALADAVWGEELPANAAGSAQVLISGLRKLLDDHGADGARVIQTAPPGYRLRAEAESCDVDRFRALRQSAAAQRAGGRLPQATALYREALRLWRGGACEDLAGIRFADEVAAELNEERLACHEATLETELALGRHAEISHELAAATAREPLRETMWALYMTALYRSGRQADALAAYRRIRELLADELGIEPGSRLREVHAAILAQRDIDPVVAPEGTQEPTTRDPAPSLPARLRFGDGRVITLDAHKVGIGRAADNAIVLSDTNVSRHHAAITAAPTGYVLSDLQSLNGTRVNGEPVIGHHILADADVIRVGDSSWTFELT